jgi:hypothetical protein
MAATAATTEAQVTQTLNLARGSSSRVDGI